MASKFVLVLYVTAFLVQAISAQFFGPGQFGPSIPYGPGYREPIGPYGPGCRDLGPFSPGCGVNVGSTGGSFPVTSVSPIAPTGLTVVSENTIEGRLGVGGQLPFLGTVALEGAFPTAGVGAISYGCGTGVGITSEGPISTGILGGSLGPVAVGPYGPGPFGCGY